MICYIVVLVCVSDGAIAANLIVLIPEAYSKSAEKFVGISIK